MFRFDGVVKPMRRGGWSARGVVIVTQHGQLIETQIGPREFPGVEASMEWLRGVAAERAIDAVQISVKPERGALAGAQVQLLA
jgi:hypothetical protein